MATIINDNSNLDEIRKIRDEIKGEAENIKNLINEFKVYSSNILKESKISEKLIKQMITPISENKSVEFESSNFNKNFSKNNRQLIINVANAMAKYIS